MGDIGKFIVGGFVGTLVMTLILYFVPPLIGQPAQDIGRMLGVILFQGPQNDMLALVAGLVIHFAMGTVVLALIYAYIVYPVFPWPGAVRGLIWGVVLYLLAQIVVMPMMPGAGGMNFSLMFGGDILGAASMWSFITHVLYGLILGGIAIKPEY